MRAKSDRQKLIEELDRMNGFGKKAARKRSMKAIRNRLWSLCKQIIRARYGNVCYTCGADRLKGSNWHTGHFVASSVCGAFLRYDLRNLRPQCYNCNINAGGNGAIFSKRMHEREGAAYVQSILDDIERITDARLHYENLIVEYGKLIGSKTKERKEANAK